MEKSVVDRVTRTATAQTVEADLAKLWSELGQQVPAARALMANLVVFRYQVGAEPVDLGDPVEESPLAEVARRHPSRVIALVHCSTPMRRDVPAAAVSIMKFPSAAGAYAIEQVSIRSECTEESLPSIVRGLTLGDLPTSVWWTEDLSRIPPLVALATIGRQFVYDSRQWRDVAAGLATIAAISAERYAPDLVDLNWRRLRPLRHALFHWLRDQDRAAAAAAHSVQIRYQPGETSLAWLLAGWLSSTFSRPGGRRLGATLEETPAGEDVLSITIATSAGDHVSAVMTEHQVAVTSSPGTPPFVVAVPQENYAEGIAAELRTLARDIGLIESVRDAHARLSVADRSSPAGSAPEPR